ncbi:MAG: cytochrome P450 [Anaerolineaceae bacterium]|nr:cytochrome P450 [Anaerolineaceae bacterium]
MKLITAHLPPGPTPRELLPRIPKIQKDALGFLLDLSAKYGDVAYFAAGSQPVYIVSHPDGVKHILQDQHRRYTKNTIQYNSLATITGRGLLTSDGPFWLRQRRLAQPAFARSRLQTLDQIVVPAARAMLEHWKEAAALGSPVDVDSEMMRLTLEVVGKALFSIDLRQDAGRLTGAVLTTLDYIVHRARNVIVPPAWVPTPRNIRFRKALNILDQAVYAMISARHAAQQPGDDLLGMLLQARDEETGQPMEDVQIRDEVLTMLIAGHETVASALTWTWYLLAQNRLEQDRFYREVSEVLGGREPCASDLPALPYTAQVFSEALRLYPPAWVISRRAIEEDNLLGYPIPAGALVIISPYVVHRREDFWADALEFHPERFDPQQEAGRHRFSYIPFGGGPRLCIGNHFAAVEAQLIMVMVAQKCRLELLPGAQVRVDALVTLRPQHGMAMLARFY